jgi:DNA invertase Pin-like site-specific DNA recombinase
VRRESQAEGIARAKRAGVYTGGKPRISRPRCPGCRPRALRVSRMSVYRIMAEAKRSRTHVSRLKPRSLVNADANQVVTPHRGRQG